MSAEAASTCPPPPVAPHDRAVPVCIGRGTPQHQLDLRDVFLLLNVDGESTISQIASRVTLPAQEVADRFLELVALGFVRIDNLDEEPPSGTFLKLAVHALAPSR